MTKLSRRAFIRAASAASGAMACAAPAVRAAVQSAAERHPRISEADDAPRLDYPIRPVRARNVTLRDRFWQPKVATNARVTIPFEVRKSIESERRLSGNVLEAAIRSLEIHPDPALRAQVDNAVEAIRSRPATGIAIAGARGTAIGTGRQNTLEILASCTEPDTAAHLCAMYRPNGVGGWFLPSRDELAALYRGLKTSGAGNFSVGVADNVTYWTSSQQTADMASHI